MQQVAIKRVFQEELCSIRVLSRDEKELLVAYVNQCAADVRKRYAHLHADLLHATMFVMMRNPLLEKTKQLFAANQSKVFLGANVTFYKASQEEVHICVLTSFKNLHGNDGDVLYSTITCIYLTLTEEIIFSRYEEQMTR